MLSDASNARPCWSQPPRAIGEEQDQAIPVIEHVVNRLRQRRLGRELINNFGQARLQRIHERSAPKLAGFQALLSAPSPDLRLDSIDRRDPLDHLAGEWRVGRLIHLYEFAARMREAKCQLDCRRIWASPPQAEAPNYIAQQTSEHIANQSTGRDEAWRCKSTDPATKFRRALRHREPDPRAERRAAPRHAASGIQAPGRKSEGLAGSPTCCRIAEEHNCRDDPLGAQALAGGDPLPGRWPRRDGYQ
jgi:hypothetical protein